MAHSENATVSPRTPKAPFLAASGLFCAVAVLIGLLAIKPLGGAELLGLLACVGAASVFATIPFVLDFARRADAARAATLVPAAQPEPAPTVAPAPAIDTAAISAEIASAVDARLAAALPELATRITASLAAAEEKRRAELQAALAAATPARPVDADAISAPAGAKPRLGRGLLGLMHSPSALSSKPASASNSTAPQDDSGDDRAAA
jgi:hypothetical protein